MPTTDLEKDLKKLGGVKTIRERLQTQRAEILALYENDLRAGQAASSESSDDIVDRANNAYNRELNFVLSDQERITLLLIEEALRRLASGEYGTCGHCARMIGLGRLEAMSWAKYCVDCQEMAEDGMLDD